MGRTTIEEAELVIHAWRKGTGFDASALAAAKEIDELIDKALAEQEQSLHAAWLATEGERLMARKAAVPTEPGWYWCRSGNEDTRKIVEVTEHKVWGLLVWKGNVAYNPDAFTDWSPRIRDPQQEWE